MSVKIRGIFSTAITYLMKQNKISIGEPSENIREHFKKTKFSEDYNSKIYDMQSKQGVIIKGELSNKIYKIFRKKFPYAVIQKKSYGSIYRGEIIELDPDTKNIHVDIGKEKDGVLPLKNYWGYVKKGEPILIQIKSEEDDYFNLSTKIHIFGKNVILIKKGFTKLPKCGKEEREKFKEIEKKLFPEEEFGILWKNSSVGKSKKELTEQIKKLKKNYEKLEKDFKKGKKIKKIMKGKNTYYCHLGKKAKNSLDELRKKIKPTIKEHHCFKSNGLNNIVDFSEQLMSSKISEKKINKEFEEFVAKKMSGEGRLFLTIHQKSEGARIYMKGKIIKKIDEDTYIIKRFIKGKGYYDGLNIKKESGDYALTTVKKDAFYVKHEYYSKNDEKKGTYYNINTPIEIYPGKAKYIDLEIDVIEVDGERKIIDEKLFEKMHKEKVISKKLYEKSREITEKIVKGEIS